MGQLRNWAMEKGEMGPLWHSLASTLGSMLGSTAGWEEVLSFALAVVVS